MSEEDVPSPIDFHLLAHAREWERQTIQKRPWRPQFFAAFVSALNSNHPGAFSVLELGSGPGHLAEQILGGCNVSRYTALDFSKPMHDLARARLGTLADKVAFIQRDFRLPDWNEGLGSFDAAVTMQAAHEVRHRRHIPAFLAHIRQALAPGGLFLYCDHYAGADGHMSPDLYLRPDDQPSALRDVGFLEVDKLMDMGGMALFTARNLGGSRRPV